MVIFSYFVLITNFKLQNILGKKINKYEKFKKYATEEPWERMKK